MYIADVVKVTAAAGSTAVGPATRSILYGFIIHAAAADVTVDVEDGTTDVITPYVLDISLNGLTETVVFPAPIRFTGQMNVTVTGTGGTVDFFHGR